ncbi:hypothetical protein OPT61_g3299 [Boeremia exigua]|uniref:Uncharacterized protein n=1 Tax=Boeremia exigua TaxID=749465 RepID=A0ACC2IIM3_9PLEO|nr:hypothetical protein OPT61_g3299 [Boeremia exigua]
MHVASAEQLLMPKLGLTAVQPRFPRPISTQQAAVNEHDYWRFDPERDATNYGLTQQQCDAAFPRLYSEIDRAVGYWKSRNHTISPADVEISWRENGAFRVLIHENEVRVLEARILDTKESYGNYTHRTFAVLNQMRRALSGATAAGEKIPTIEFSVVVDDFNEIPDGQNDTHAIGHFARRLNDASQERVWLIPDFNFWSAPATGGIVEFEETRLLARQHDSLLTQKTPQAVWRGAVWTNEPVRGALLNVTRNQSWADVMEIDWKTQENMIRTEDMCDYMFLVHTEGQTWSGRLKYLLNCDSVPVVHELDWTTHYYHLLEHEGPDQNYVLVKRDFSDLEENVLWFLKHPEQAQRIANNAAKTFRGRYTTLAAEGCYWRRLFRGWANVSYTLDPYQQDHASGERVLRGIAVQDYLKLEHSYQL